MLEDAALREGAAKYASQKAAEGWTPLAPFSPEYPHKLKHAVRAPQVLWLLGEADGIASQGVAVVGSRQLTPPEARFASEAGSFLARAGLTLFSGGAVGADSFASAGAKSAGGKVFHFLPGGQPLYVEPPVLSRSPDSPPFDRIEALRRNRWIYSSASAAILVASRFEKGGSWSGAIMARRERLCPVLVFMSDEPSSGNAALAKLGSPQVRSSDELAAALSRAVPLDGKLAI